MSQGVKGGLTLPWLWVAVLIAFFSLAFMLPPLNKPMVELGKTKLNVEPAGSSDEKAGEIVFQ
jgi:hypothetical protein